MKFFCDDMSLSILSDERFEPCRVCGEPSSGWHCGAVTCEACKKFFLRSINGEDAKYKCSRNKECVIVRTTRTQCQYCRFQKCKEVGMTISESPNCPSVGDLFKTFGCVVCRAPASGLHFGVVTCEGCKGFFRRSIKERAPDRYRCHENTGACEINATSRNMCRFCRYKRCVDMGMSAQNSRIGRQSNLFKHMILEMKARGDHNVNPQLLIGQRKMTKQRIKTEALNGTTTTTTTTTMTATNLSLMATNNGHLVGAPSAGSALSRSGGAADCEMLNVTSQQRTMTTSNGGGQTAASGSYAQAPQPIIAVNQFTTNQYIINTGGQPVMGAPVSLPAALTTSDNFMKLTASNTTAAMLGTAGHYASNNSSGYYGTGTSAPNSAWYNTNDFNLDFNNNQISSAGNLNQLGYSMHVPAIMPAQAPNQLMSSLQQQPPALPQSSSQSRNPQSDMEDDSRCDQASRELIKTVYRSYYEFLRPDVIKEKRVAPSKSANYSRQGSLNPYNGYQMMPYQADYENENNTFFEIIEHFKFYISQHIQFINSILMVSTEYKDLSIDDKQELMRSSIHSVVALSILRCFINDTATQNRESSLLFLNYFHVEPAKLEKFLRVLPCFEKASSFMKKLREKLDKHRLDDKETALLLAVITFTTANKNIHDYEKISGFREKLGAALRLYMSIRRNEEIVCDDIMICLLAFKKFNQELISDLGAHSPNKRENKNFNEAFSVENIYFRRSNLEEIKN